MFDFNKVELFSYSGGNDPYMTDMSLEDQIEYVAKVSNPSGQAKFDEREPGRLTKYLINHAHWSPLEMAHVVLKIDTTRDIGRQVLRHRSFSFQEFSQRYAEVNADFVEKQARSQDMKNRQNSNDDMAISDKLWFQQAQTSVADHANDIYTAALERGIAKEVARIVLPEGMTPTTFFMAGSVRSWYHYCDLRCANGTQAEHMDLALKCHNVLSEYMPNLFPEGKYDV